MSSRAAHAGRRLLAMSGLIAAAGGVVATIPSVRVDPHRYSAGADDPAVAWLLVLAAAALITAGVVAWLARPGSGLAIIAFWAAAAWLGPELVGSPTVTREARTLGLVLAPFVMPLLVHLPLRAVRADRGGARIALVALYLVTAVTAVGHALTWDAFLLSVCLPMCQRGDNVLGWFVDNARSAGFAWVGLGATLVAAGGLAAWAVRGSRRASADPGRDRWVRIPALATGLTGMAWALARMVVEPPDPTGDWAVRTAVALGVAVTSLGIGVAWVRFGEGHRAARVRSLEGLLDAGAGSRSLGETLATLLRDPTVRVAYPVDRLGQVDDQGVPVSAPVAAPGRAVTAVERGGTVIALVEHAADLDPDLLAREIGAAARLAVDNERLATLLRAQVRELQASRERIVATGDAARGRLERDLHDGAQQRLLAVSYELRLAHAAAAGDAPDRRAALAAAVEEIDRALAELRDLAHGIWPAVLAEAGLEAALGSLADEATIPVTLDAIPDQRFPSRTEAAAYLAVTEALRRATIGGATSLRVRARDVGDRLRLEAHIPGLALPGPWLRVDDRVGAAGGRSEVTTDPAAGTLLTVELPCA